MSRQHSWREFETLVAAIEAQAAPKGATVKSPDLIRDLVTGEMREVDASIRFRAGTSEILVTVECRDRNRKADVTWIEQLASKRQKVGAARTIAVSAKGFTKSAVQSARFHGIELRRLSEVKPHDIEKWLLPAGSVHLFKQVENIQCEVKIDGRDEYIKLSDSMKPCFLHRLVHAPFPASAFVSFIEMKQPKVFWYVPIDGTKTRLAFDLDASAPDLIPVPLGVITPENCPLQLQLDDQLSTVKHIRLSLDVSYEVNSFEADEGKHHLYEADDGTTIQHSRFSGEAFGLPVTFDLQSMSGQALDATLEFPSGVRLESQCFPAGREMLDLVSQAVTPKPAVAECRFCGERCRIAPSPLVPNYLFPSNADVPVERLLCRNCTEKFSTWDDYGKKLLAAFPENVSEFTGSYFALGQVDYCRLRLLLLSLFWRMAVAKHPIWRDVKLEGDADRLKGFLLRENPGTPGQYPAGCVVPSFDGHKFDIVLQPDSVETPGGRLIRAVLGGVVFLFSVREAADEGKLEELYIRPGGNWIVPVVEWKKIDFLRSWVDSLRRG